MSAKDKQEAVAYLKSDPPRVVRVRDSKFKGDDLPVKILFFIQYCNVKVYLQQPNFSSNTKSINFFYLNLLIKSVAGSRWD